LTKSPHIQSGNRNIPLVSVVITTFNSSACIADALISVLTQSFSDFEIVLVDDASTDDTVEIARTTLDGKCTFRIERLISNSGGPAAPRNIGVGIARGRWIALLDSDDAWVPDKLRMQLEVAENSNVGFVSSEKRWFSKASDIRRQRESPQEEDPKIRLVTHADLCRKNFLCTSSVLAERTLFLRHPFRTDRDYIAVEDYACWLDIHRVSIPHHPQILCPLVYYRVSVGSISAAKMRMVRKHWLLYRNYFRATRFGFMKAVFSMLTYMFASIYRQLYYRLTRH